jgi:hypothetical protein
MWIFLCLRHEKFKLTNRSAVSHNVVVVLCEVPVLSQHLFEQVLAGTRGDTESTVVRTHYGANVSLLNACLERREVVVGEILLRGVVIVAVSSSLEVVDSVMLILSESGRRS